jgi:hypothetical protein
MGQLLHGRARATAAVCRAIQHGQENAKRPASRHAINPKTAARWHRGSSGRTLGRAQGNLAATTLSVGPEAIAAAFCKHALLPLDDGLYALQATMPPLTRPAFHRCFQRHGISRLPRLDTPDPPRGGVFRAHFFGLMCARKDIGHRLTKPSHPRTNDQVERMNRTLKETTVRTCHCANMTYRMKCGR